MKQVRCVSFILSTVMRYYYAEKITSHTTIYIWIRSEIIQDYFKDFVYCFNMTAKKKEKKEKERIGHPQKVCTTGVLPNASILKLLK